MCSNTQAEHLSNRIKNLHVKLKVDGCQCKICELKKEINYWKCSLKRYKRSYMNDWTYDHLKKGKVYHFPDIRLKIKELEIELNKLLQ